jgi:serine phosphatase RsbU (regulator of sigma subunit)
MISRLLDQEKVSQEVDWAKKLLHAISAAETTCFCGMPLARFASLSHEIKGDMLDLCEDENNSFIGVYDAFHHGIPAVLTLNIMYAVMRCFNETKTQLQQVNRVLRQFTQELCSAATIIRIKQRHIELANAGNPSPLVISHKGVKRIFEQPSRPVGYEKDIQLQLSSFELAEGELLFCSTNGVYKAFEHLYGKSLEQFIDETCDHPEELHSRISQAISSLTRQNFSDDITFITAGQP